MADPENSKPPRPKKGKGIKAKIVKHAHRRRFQEYVRTKGRDKSTIAYVYWSMYLRSGKGDVFELEEGLFLADLGIGKNALRPARKTLVDDGWLSKGRQKVDPVTGKWGTTAWTVNTEPVAQSEGNGTAAPSTGDRFSGDRSTAARSVGDTVVLHPLYADASTSSCTPSASTPPETKEERKEPLLAPLVAEAVEHLEEEEEPSKASELESEEKQNQEPEEQSLHPSVWSLRRIWKDRTGYLFTVEDFALANKLIRAYRYRVVEAVLRNTLWMRANSAKLRWNKFSIFAKHWQRNHEEYLAWCATGHLDKKRGNQTPAQKFDPIPEEGWVEANVKEFNALAAWFREHGKVGEWTVSIENLGLRKEYAYVAMKYLGDEGIAVTKEVFLDLLMEVASIKAVGAAVGGFDVEEA
jgi:hypothetical protein